MDFYDRLANDSREIVVYAHSSFLMRGNDAGMFHRMCECVMRVPSREVNLFDSYIAIEQKKLLASIDLLALDSFHRTGNLDDCKRNNQSSISIRKSISSFVCAFLIEFTLQIANTRMNAV